MLLHRGGRKLRTEACVAFFVPTITPISGLGARVTERFDASVQPSKKCGPGEELALRP
jgi:hypothetical protein